MRVVAPLAALLLAVTALAAILYCAGPTGPPRHATIREILADPEWYDGQLVIVNTSGMQPAEKPGDLVYRKFAGRAPELIVEFSTPPLQQPISVIGRVKVGKPIAIKDCRPAP